MSKTTKANQRVVVARAMPELDSPDQRPIVVLGMNPDSWHFMKDGLTHVFDLAAAGLNGRIILFRGPSYGAVTRALGGEADPSAMSRILGQDQLTWAVGDQVMLEQAPDNDQLVVGELLTVIAVGLTDKHGIEAVTVENWAGVFDVFPATALIGWPV